MCCQEIVSGMAQRIGPCTVHPSELQWSPLDDCLNTAQLWFAKVLQSGFASSLADTFVPFSGVAKHELHSMLRCDTCPGPANFPFMPAYTRLSPRGPCVAANTSWMLREARE